MMNKQNINKKKQSFIIYIVLAVVTLAVFWQVNKFDFINFDDNLYITENIHIQSGLSPNSIRWAFSTNDVDGLWHPLVWLSFMLDYELFGLNAGGYHVTNLILHILSTLLLFWLFNRMTKEILPSAFVAAFFALHPLHVESVAWISERKDVLSAFFWMLTLCLYVYYTEKPAVKRYLLVLCSFVLALMSKPMVITLPLIMILLDYWPLSRFRIGIESQRGKINPVLRQLKEKLPFFALSVFFSIITIYGQYDASQKNFLFDYRMANASVSFVTYLAKTFWPHDLAVFYPFLKQIPPEHIWGAIILIIIISSFVIITAKRLPYLFVGWFWYAITVLPVIGIIQSGYQAMADRYHYLPSIGIAVGLAWGVPLLFQNENMRKKILFPATIAALCTLLILTLSQCGYWKNSIELFRHTLRVTHDNALAHNQLGLAFFEKNKDTEALYHYNKSIIIQPIQDSAYNNRGVVYLKNGQFRQALDDFNKAIAINPSYIRAYNNRANIYVQTGHYDLAIKDLSNAIRFSPNYINAYYNRGFLFAKIGQYQNALKDFNRVIILNPNYADAYSNRATVYLNMGNIQSGCHDAKKACGLGICTTLQIFTGKGLCR